MPSRQVEERIVEMRFDNAQFEKAANETLASLDRIEKAIKFEGAKSGISDIQRAFDGFDVSRMGSAIDSIKDRFSTLGIIGMRVTENIVDSLVGKVKQIGSAVGSVFDQIESGGMSRALNMDQARFMLRGLTGDLEKVEEILGAGGPVDKAVTDTKFGLDEAALAAANFYTVGVTGTEELEKSLQAVSGVASLTGKEYSMVADKFIDVAAAGKLTGKTVSELQFMGINVNQEMIEFYKNTQGVSYTLDDIKDKIKDGEVSVDDFTEAMHRFWSTASEANTTYAGSLANMKAQLSKIGEQVKTVYLQQMIGIQNAVRLFLKETVRPELNSLIDLINKTQESLGSLAVSFIQSSEVGDSALNLIDAATIAYETLGKVVERLVKSMPFLNKIPSLLVSVTGKIYEMTDTLSATLLDTLTFDKMSKSISHLAYGFLSLKPAVEDVVSLFKISLGIIGDFFKEVISVDSVETVFFNIAKAMRSLGSAVETVYGYLFSSGVIYNLRSIVVAIADAIRVIVNLVKNLASALQPLVRFAGDLFSLAMSALGTIARYINAFSGDLLKDNPFARMSESLRDFLDSALPSTEVVKGWSTKINGFIMGILPPFDKVKEKISSVINFVLNFHKTISGALNSIKEKIDSTFSGRHFWKQLMDDLKDLGPIEKAKAAMQKFVDFIKKIFSGKDSGQGGQKPTFLERIEAYADKVKEFMHRFDSLGDKFKAIKTKMQKTLDEIFGSTFREKYINLENFIRLINVSLFTVLGVLVNKYTRDLFKDMRKLTDVTKSAKDILGALIDKFKSGFKKEINNFNKTLNSLTDALNAMTKKVEIQLLKQLAISILMIAASAVALAMVDPAKLAAAMTAITVAFVDLIGSMTVINKLDKKTKFRKGLDNITSNMIKLSIAVLIMAMAVLKMVKAIDKIKKMMDEGKDGLRNTIISVGIIEILFFSLAGMMIAMKKCFKGKPVDIKNVIALVGVVFALKMLIGGLKSIRKMIKSEADIGYTLMALSFLEIAMWSLVGVMKTMKTITRGKPIDSKNVLAILTFVIAVRLLIGGLKSIRKMIKSDADIGYTLMALSFLEIAMWSLVGVMKVMKKLKGNGLDAKVVITMLAFVIAIRVLIQAFLQIRDTIKSEADIGYSVMALSFLEIVMWSLYGVIAAMKKLKGKSIDKSTIFTLIAVVVALRLLITGFMQIRSVINSEADIGYTVMALSFLEIAMWSLLGLMAAMKKLKGKSVDSKSVLGIIAFVVAIRLLLDGMLEVRKVISSPKDILYTSVAFGIIEAAMWSLFGLLAALKNLIKGKGMDPKKLATSVGTILIVMLSIKQLVGAMIQLKDATGNTLSGLGYLAASFAILELTMWSLIGILAVIVKITKKINPKDRVIATIGFLTSISGVMIPLVGQLSKLMKTIHKVGLADAIAGFVAFEALLWSLTAVLYVFTKIGKNAGDVKAMLEVSAAMAVLAIAISLLVPSITKISLLGKDALAGAGAIAIFVGAFVALGALVGNFPAIGVGMLMLSGTLLVFSAAIVVLSIGIETLIVSLGILLILLKILAKTQEDDLVKGSENLIIMLDALGAAFIKIGELLAEMVVSFIKTLADKAPEVVGAFLKMFDELLTQITVYIPKMVNTVLAFIGMLLVELRVYLPLFVDLLLEIITGILNAIAENMPGIVSAGLGIIEGLLRGIADGLPGVIDAAFEVIVSFIEGLADAIDAHGEEIRQACQHLLDAILGFFIGTDSEGVKGLRDAGVQVVAGFIEGFQEKWAGLKSIVSGLVNGFVDWFKGLLGIASPSKVFMEIGVFTIQGFEKGIEKESKEGRRVLEQSMKSMFEDMDTNLFNDAMASNLSSAKSTLNIYRDAMARIMSNNNDLKRNIDSNRKYFKDELAYRKSARNLTAAQKEELSYLQEKLRVQGDLTDTELGRLGRLLGFTKEEELALDNVINLRNQNIRDMEKNNEEIERYNGLIQETEAIINSGAAYSFGKYQSSIEVVNNVLKDFALSLYKQTDEYKENQKSIEDNTKAIEAYQNGIDSMRTKIDDARKHIDSYNSSMNDLLLSREYEIKLSNEDSKTLSDLDNKEQKLYAKKKKNSKLTADEIEQLEDIKKSRDKIALKYIAEAIASNELQEKIKQGIELTDDEITQLAELLKLSDEELIQLKGAIKARSEEYDKIEELNDSIAEYKQGIVDCADANEELNKYIESNTDALLEFHNTIKENIKNAINPFNAAIEDTIDLMSKFEASSVDFDLDNFLTENTDDYKKRQEYLEQLASMNFNEGIMAKLKDASDETIKKYLSLSEDQVKEVNRAIGNQLVENLASFGLSYQSWKDEMSKLSEHGFNEAVIERLRAMGPEGLNLVKSYLEMEEDQVKAANEALLYSSRQTFDQWMEQRKKAIEDQKKYIDDLNLLRFSGGLSDEAYRELMSMGQEAGQTFVDALKISPDRIPEFNDMVETYNTLPEQLAGKAVLSAAASGSEIGSELRNAIVESLNSEALMSDTDIAAIQENLKGFVDAIKTSIVIDPVEMQNSGADTGAVYIDGMAMAIDDNGYLVYNASSDVASDAKDGVENYLSKKNGEEIGKNMDDGLVAGLQNNGGKVAAAARAVAYQAYAAAMAALEIASPSKKFIEIGKFVDLGFAKGIEDYSSKVSTAVTDMSDESLMQMNDVIARVSDILNPSDDALVIKPILDLSNVRAGALEMSRMFNNAHIKADELEVDADDAALSGAGNTYSFVQNNYSPKALSRIDIYRNTKNQFAMLKGATV